MIVFYACVGLTVLLFLLLFALGTGAERGEEEPDEGHEAFCPLETVQRIFSGQDLAYIERERSRSLRRMYLSERQRVAMGWIRCTSERLHRTMKAHVRAARERQDLEPAVEVLVLFEYVRLRCLCGLLLLSVFVARPSAVQELAIYANRLSHRIDMAQRRKDGAGEAVPARIPPAYGGNARD
jgi:hypothetical protein